MLNRISFSRMSLLRSSPEEFVRVYLLNGDRFTSKAMERGKILHELIHNILMKKVDVDYVVSKLSEDPFGLDCLTVLNKIFKFLSGKEIVFSEREIVVPYKEFELVGIVDLAFRYKNELYICDYKFTSAKDGYKPDANQLKFYNYLLDGKCDKALFLVANLNTGYVSENYVNLRDYKETSELIVEDYIKRLKALLEVYEQTMEGQRKRCGQEV